MGSIHGAMRPTDQPRPKWAAPALGSGCDVRLVELLGALAEYAATGFAQPSVAADGSNGFGIDGKQAGEWGERSFAPGGSSVIDLVGPLKMSKRKSLPVASQCRSAKRRPMLICCPRLHLACSLGFVADAAEHCAAVP